MTRNTPDPRHREPDPVLRFMRVMWAMGHELQRVSKRMEAALGLTVPQRMTLLLVGRQPGILAGELAELLHLHPGTISGIIRRLDAAGLIERTGDAADGRRVRLTLTAAGFAANQRRSGTFESAVRELLAAAPSADVAATERVLTALADTLDKTASAHAAAPARR